MNIFSCAVRHCLLLAGCAAVPPPDAPPRPLSSSINGATITALAEFAAVTRMCRDTFNRKTEERIERYFRENPREQIYPMLHGWFSDYEWCVTHTTASACDATPSDLGSVRTLLREDPRLAAFKSFDQLLAEREGQCPAQKDLLAQVVRAQARDERVPGKCEEVWLQPVLTTLSAGVHVGEFTHHRTKHNCSGSLAYQFLENHCPALTNGRRLVPRLPWTKDELGVEEYLCPIVDSGFIPNPPRQP
jgi:hypothetical protein